MTRVDEEVGIERVELSETVMNSLRNVKRPNFPFGRKNGTVMNKLLDKAYAVIRRAATNTTIKE